MGKEEDSKEKEKEEEKQEEGEEEEGLLMLFKWTLSVVTVRSVGLLSGGYKTGESESLTLPPRW